MSTNKIKIQSIIADITSEKISAWALKNLEVPDLIEFLSTEFQIDCTTDQTIIQGFDRDSSNLPGKVDALCRPVNEYECVLVLRCCQMAKIPVTISAGRTNLTGSATPEGGLVLSIEKMTQPSVKIDLESKTLTSPVGIFLEDMRKDALRQSNNKLHFPVDPTSREEALVGGILSCNASGFIPGPAGATRFWTEGLEFLTPNGHKMSCRRGEYISENGEFILEFPDESVSMKILTYPRPDIKNASGPYSDEDGSTDLVDLIVGSEGIFGLITSVIFRLKKMPTEFLDLFFTLPTEVDAVNFHQYINDYFNGDLFQITALEYFGYNCQPYMDHQEELFNSTSEVGIYFQIPLYDKCVEDVAEDWLDILKNSKCGIQEEGILLLNDPQNWRTFFNARHSIPSNALDKTRQLDTWSILTDTIVPPENFPEFLDSTHSILQKANIEYLLFGHLGDCHLHFHLIPTRDQQSKALEAYNQIVEKSANLGGVYSAEHGTGKRKRPDFLKCYGQGAVDQVRLAKAAMDPDFLLNRGNVVEPTDVNTRLKLENIDDHF